MKALALVAHPDDCIIFAYSYIYNHPQYSWTIGYLTYTAIEPRGAEMVKFWNKRNNPTIFLGFEDHWHDNEHRKFTRWNSEDAITSCWNLAKDYDLVLTHDENGDYGHIHHKLVHDAVNCHKNLITFAPPGQGQEYQVPANTYSLEELPLHRDVIEPFHLTGHKNCYKELKCI